jgi:hypothetical protein
MIKEEVLTEEDYVMWKNHPLTQRLFIRLKEIREAVQSSISTEEVIFSPNSQVLQARTFGYVEGVDLVLTMESEDLIDNNNEAEVE